MPLTVFEAILFSLLFLFAASGLILYFVLRARARITQAELALLICLWLCLLAGFTLNATGQTTVKEFWTWTVFATFSLLSFGSVIVMKVATETNARWAKPLASLLFRLLKRR